VLTMLTTLMDITEAESGVMQLRREVVSIEKLLVEVIDVYQLIADEKQIPITSRFDQSCDAAVDSVRMRQVFANLLDIRIEIHGGRRTHRPHVPEGRGPNRRAVR